MRGQSGIWWSVARLGKLRTSIAEIGKCSRGKKKEDDILRGGESINGVVSGVGQPTNSTV